VMMARETGGLALLNSNDFGKGFPESTRTRRSTTRSA
jgi:hypothetical protein